MRPRLTVALTGDFRLGRVQADTRGLTSGATLSADKWVWGGDLGVGMQWAPSDRVPLALDVDVAAGRLDPTVTETVADGYTPFARGFGARRLQVGIAWRPGAARRATSDAAPRR